MRENLLRRVLTALVLFIAAAAGYPFLDFFLPGYGPYLVAPLVAAGLVALYGPLLQRRALRYGVAVLIAFAAIFGLETYAQVLLGRKLLADWVDASLAGAASIHSAEVGRWLDPTMLVSFSAPAATFNSALRGFAPLRRCGLERGPFRQLVSALPPKDKVALKIHWRFEVHSLDDQKTRGYHVVVAFDEKEERGWLYRSWLLTEEKAPTVEGLITKSDRFLDGSSLVLECTDGPFAYHMREVSPKGIVRAEYDLQKVGGKEENLVRYDETGKPYEGRVDFPPGSKLDGYYSYRAGILQGPFELTFPETGKTAFKGEYKDGKLEGPYAEYHEDGSVKKSVVYQAGKIVQ